MDFQLCLDRGGEKTINCKSLESLPSEEHTFGENNWKSLFLRTKDPSKSSKNGIMYMPSSLIFEVLETALNSRGFLKVSHMR